MRHSMWRSWINLPVLNATGLRGEADADFDNFPAVRKIGSGILSLINLTESLLGGVIILQLDDIDIVFGIDHYVYSAVGGLHLRSVSKPIRLVSRKKALWKLFSLY